MALIYRKPIPPLTFGRPGSFVECHGGSSDFSSCLTLTAVNGVGQKQPSDCLLCHKWSVPPDCPLFACATVTCKNPQFSRGPLNRCPATVWNYAPLVVRRRDQCKNHFRASVDFRKSSRANVLRRKLQVSAQLPFRRREALRKSGTVPIFVPTTMGLSPLPRTSLNLVPKLRLAAHCPAAPRSRKGERFLRGHNGP